LPSIKKERAKVKHWVLLVLLISQKNECGKLVISYKENKAAAEELVGVITSRQKVEKHYIANIFKKIKDPNIPVRFKAYEEEFDTCPLVAALIMANPETLAPFFRKQQWTIPVNFNFEDKEKNTPLHHALTHTQTQSDGALRSPIDMLLDQEKININKQSNYGISPLMLAAQRGEASYFDRLIGLGADIQAKDGAGLSVGDYAELSEIYPNPIITIITEINEAEKNLNATPQRERPSTPYYCRPHQERTYYQNPLFMPTATEEEL
jgi:hypothetical protein